MTRTSSPLKLPTLHRLIRDMSSEAYHGTQGTWSSSQLKDLIDDEELFIQKYIRKSVDRVEKEAFDTGTYFHTGVLEPHKIAKEIAVFTGKTRYGKNWDTFKSKHAGKVVITDKQKIQGDNMIKAVKASPVAMEYLYGDPEVSLFVQLVIKNGNIYAPFYGVMLTPEGWVDCSHKIEKLQGKDFSIVVKVRADCLGGSFVSDLKSTSGRANQQSSIRQSISKYKYDLSAALYLDIFSLLNDRIHEFIWIFASKEMSCSGTWRATKNQILVGRAKYSWALKRLADLASANWEVIDYLREAEPLPHELEWLQVRETDLL